MKQVRETSAGKSISAYVILKKGKEIASVQAHYGNSRVSVDVWDNASELQQGYAGGYGYDKFTSAISGLIIDGIVLNDHCGTDKRTVRILQDYQDGKITEEQAEAKAKRIGASFANYSSDNNKHESLYLRSGLDKLTALGYKVIQAI